MPHSGRRLLLGAAALAALAAPRAAALAQPAGGAAAADWPRRTVTIIVPAAPGGTLDALARFLAQAMGPALGRNVVVENVSGGSGLVGLQRAMRAEADGHTLVFGNMGIFAALVAMNPDAGFDPRRDLAPVGLVAHVPMVLSAGPRSGIRTLSDLLDHIRRNGDRATFGTAGVGTTSHLAPAYLLHLTGLKATLVSYRGAGPAMNDLAAGVVDAVIDQTVTMIPAHRGGTAVALAVSARERIPQLPDIPTFAEAGVPAFDLVVWNALAAPRGTPPGVIARLAEAIEAALNDAEMRRRLSDLAAIIPAAEERGPQALGALIQRDVAKWIEVVQQTGLSRQ
jgi:tripartite-type tricarboxylate transporter receptor subunit TctC